MIVVTAPSKDGTEEHEFDTNYADVVDGALVIFEDRPGMDRLFTVAGFSPAAWITFEVVPDAD